MTGTQVAQVIFSILIVLSAYFAYDYALAGEWGKTVIPIIVLVWCTYRVFTMEEEE